MFHESAESGNGRSRAVRQLGETPGRVAADRAAADRAAATRPRVRLRDARRFPRAAAERPAGQRRRECEGAPPGRETGAGRAGRRLLVGRAFGKPYSWHVGQGLPEDVPIGGQGLLAVRSHGRPRSERGRRGAGAIAREELEGPQGATGEAQAGEEGAQGPRGGAAPAAQQAYGQQRSGQPGYGAPKGHRAAFPRVFSKR